MEFQETGTGGKVLPDNDILVDEVIQKRLLFWLGKFFGPFLEGKGFTTGGYQEIAHFFNEFFRI